VINDLHLVGFGVANAKLDFAGDWSWGDRGHSQVR
jgi:hypothetical protein